ALCFSNEKKKRRALAAAREAVRLAPDQSNQHHVLGWVHMQFGQHRRSIAPFKNALRLAPDDPAIYDSLAAVFSWQGRYRTALRMAERGLKYDADHVGCHYRRAEALHGIGRHGEAEEALRTVLHQNAEHPQAQGFLGHYAAQRGDPTTALPLLRNALRTDADCTFMQSAWKEGLRNKYLLYRFLTKVRYCLVERYRYSSFIVLFAIVFLLVVLWF